MEWNGPPSDCAPLSAFSSPGHGAGMGRGRGGNVAGGNRIGWDGTGWDGVGWDGTGMGRGWNGTGGQESRECFDELKAVYSETMSRVLATNFRGYIRSLLRLQVPQSTHTHTHTHTQTHTHTHTHTHARAHTHTTMQRSLRCSTAGRSLSSWGRRVKTSVGYLRWRRASRSPRKSSTRRARRSSWRRARWSAPLPLFPPLPKQNDGA